jgi:ketosteroid isomerase-like protein
MTRRTALFTVFVALGCRESGYRPEPDPICDRTEAAVLSAAEGLVAADNRHDLEGVLDHYADDVTFITSEGELVEGKSAVRPRYQELFGNFVVEIEMESEEVVVGSEWAFVRGRNVGTLTSRTDDVVEALDDRFLMILHCEPGHDWRVSRLMWVHLE